MTRYLALEGCEVYTPTEKISNSLVLIDNSSVVYIGTRSSIDLPKETKVYDLSNLILTPGFIDLQVNGFGKDTILSSKAHRINQIAKNLFKRGTTSFLPTITSCSIKTALSASDAIKSAWENQDKISCSESCILGVHLEGPFFNPKMCGAHPTKFIRKIDTSEIELIAEACGGYGRSGNPGLRMVTFSPELENSLYFVKWLLERNIVPAIGHTMASSEEIKNCINAGARFAVHVYNRYSSKDVEAPAHRRDDPMLEVIKNPLLYAGIISDGIHVSPGLVENFVRNKGWTKIVLTSDLVSDIGLFPRQYRSKKVLEGSKFSLGEVLPFFKKWSGVDDISAIATLTRNPAKLLGLEEKLGTIVSGSKVDFCVLDKKTLRHITSIKGQNLFIEQNKEIQDRLIL
tara:strand:+ start:2472 stop:3674 length:1203 start_codon:yes stop_codon:yes gene_type:complete